MRDKQLDGLRGVAAIGVVIFHAHYSYLLEWMWTFVDLFFVLSGFLITRIVLTGLANDSFSFKNFMIRRILRIWPIYYATLAFCMLIVLLNFVMVGEWGHTSGLLSAPFFLQFTHHYFESSLNSGSEDFIFWFHHSWSIAVEEQFYLLMPFLMIALKGRLTVALLVIVALIPIAVLARAEGAFHWLLISRMDALCIGVVLAFYWMNKGRTSGIAFEIGKFWALCLMLVGFLLILIDPLSVELSPHLTKALSLLGFNILFGVVILVLMEGWFPPLNSLMASSVLVFFGSISYALYLFHLPVRGALMYISGQESMAACSLWVQVSYYGLSILAAYLSKIFIEDRLNKFKHRFPVFK